MSTSFKKWLLLLTSANFSPYFLNHSFGSTTSSFYYATMIKDLNRINYNK